MTPAELAAFPTFREMEADYLARVLEACEWNVTLAARVSGVGRATLYRKVVDLGLQTSRARERLVRLETRAQLEKAFLELRGSPPQSRDCPSAAPEAPSAPERIRALIRPPTGSDR